MKVEGGIAMSQKQAIDHVAGELTEEMKELLDMVADGICGIDIEGRATFCNDALLKMTGYSAEELIGASVHELMHHSRRDGTPFPAEECALQRALGTREAKQISGEFLCRKDGTRFPAEYWLRSLERARGKTRHVVTVRDMSEVERTRDVLWRNEEKFRKILASAPDVAWTADRQGRTVYISPRAEAVLGYSKREVYASGTSLWLSQVHPQDFGRVHEAYAQLFANQTAFDQEFRMRRKDGQWIWVHSRAMNTREEGGAIYADGFLCDITQRKVVEAELRSQQALLEAQVNSTIDGMLVVDRDGQILMTNERLGQLFNIPAALREEKNDGRMLEYVVTLIKDPELFLAKVNHLYKHADETSSDEIELKNGMILDRYSAPVTDKSGFCYGRIWTFRDITERKRNEEELQQLSLAVEQSPVSVVITDPAGNISYVNRKFTECSGYSLEEVAGRNPRILNAGHMRPEVYRDLWATITAGRLWHGELCNKRKNGEIFWEAATVAPITSPKGEITHFLAVKEDITERRALETQLRQAQKLEGIGQLAAGIAHEINTPTQFVTDNLTFLRDSCQSFHSVLGMYREAVSGAEGAIPASVVGALQQAEKDCDLDFIECEAPRAIEQSMEGAARVAKIVRAMKEFSHPDSAEKTATDLNKGDRIDHHGGA